MRYLFAFVVFLTSGLCFSFEAEPVLSDKDKIQIKSTLADVYNSGGMEKKDYDQALSYVDAYPCEGVDRQLNPGEKEKLASAVASSEELAKAEVLESFSFNAWKIVYVNTYESDEAYYFYDRFPDGKSKSLTIWSGAATVFETSQIEKWILDNAKGIPKELASCFAWHVTLNRD